MSTPELSSKALQLILEHEGFSQPSHWPGGASGITIGYGYDLGYRSRDEFQRDWGHRLPAAVVDRLMALVGMRGELARLKAPALNDIVIPRDAAAAVLQANTIPWATRETCRVFVGADRLPADAFGALVSLVFNRGGSVAGDSRREMLAIQKAVLTLDLKEIATQLRSMKRLWAGKGLDGLLRRRDDEAALVESCLKSSAPTA